MVRRQVWASACALSLQEGGFCCPYKWPASLCPVEGWSLCFRPASILGSEKALECDQPPREPGSKVPMCPPTRCPSLDPEVPAPRTSGHPTTQRSPPDTHHEGGPRRLRRSTSRAAPRLICTGHRARPWRARHHFCTEGRGSGWGRALQPAQDGDSSRQTSHCLIKVKGPWDHLERYTRQGVQSPLGVLVVQR